jgi:hypothetical protein
MTIIKVICQICFGIMTGINLIFIAANLLTIIKILPDGMGTWSGYIITDYLLFALIPGLILLLFSSLISYLKDRVLWTIFKAAYFYLGLALLSFVLVDISYSICHTCRM